MLPGSVMERGEGAWAALGRRACIKNAAGRWRGVWGKSRMYAASEKPAEYALLS